MNRSGRIALVVALGVGGLAAAAPALQESKQEKGAAPAAQTATLPSHASILTGLMPTQAAQTATPEQRLAQAKLIADGEHDPERALKLLAALAAETGVASEVRAQAFVAAARCLNQLGRGDEAKLQLQAAAQLKGPGADEAKHLLDAGLTDQQLELRIAKAIDELFGTPNPSSNVIELLSALRKNRTAGDLIWVGAPAVPRLATVLAGVDHLGNVTGSAYLLARINNDAAASAIREAVKRNDPFYKRAILAGFPNGDDVKHEPVRSAVMTLLQDPDPRVRQWVLAGAQHLETEMEVLPLTRDPDVSVRIAAWSAIEGQNAGTDERFEEELVMELRRCLKEDPDDVRRVAVARFKGNPRLFRRDSGRALFVETLLDPVLTKPSEEFRTDWMWGPQSSNERFGAPVALDLIVRVATSLGRLRHWETDRWVREGDNRHDALTTVLSKSEDSGSQQGAHTGWPAEERSKLWPLLRLGYGETVWKWIAANVTADDLPAVAESLVACGDLVTLYQVMNSVAVAQTPNSKPKLILSAEQKSAIAKSILTLFQTDGARQPWIGHSEWVANQLIQLGVDESDRAVVRALLTAPNGNLVAALLNRRDPPVDVHRLPDLVTIATENVSRNEGARNDALGRIAAAHLPELPTILARCYELGLEAVNTGPPPRPRGFAWLVVHEPYDGDEGTNARKPSTVRPQPPSQRQSIRAEWGAAYTAADVRAAFESCARTGSADFWIDIRIVLDVMPQEGPLDPVAIELLTQVEAGITQPDASALARSNTSRENLVAVVLSRRPPGWKEFVLANCLDREIGDAVVSYAPEIFPELIEKLAAIRDDAAAGERKALVQHLKWEKDPALRARAADFLNDPNGEVRRAVISTFFARSPEKALDLVLPLAKDTDSNVRFELFVQLASCFDRRAIPVLVDGLQDPAPGNREVAKKSLDSLQYVFEQKEKWKRMLEGAGLDSANAAEALVKQAAASQPKATRLVAIESLGTLGVAETLPVLITFMGEKDAEIAAAAKAAVEKINRRAAEKESAPAGKSPPAKGQ